MIAIRLSDRGHTAGGQVTGTPEAADAISETRSMKPISGIVDPLAASAGFWIAAQRSELIGVPSSDLGSIGVCMLHIESSKLLHADLRQHHCRARTRPPCRIRGPGSNAVEDALTVISGLPLADTALAHASQRPGWPTGAGCWLMPASLKIELRLGCPLTQSSSRLASSTSRLAQASRRKMHDTTKCRNRRAAFWLTNLSVYST
ncbi:hypothetical protein ACE103_08635 [Bradyrhizobium sp. ma5]|uniref:hypothetical protein n=1 Tax=Bradyrhizobium sp. ma5 TaxID=3344828 RepID=UPI0035D47CA9